MSTNENANATQSNAYAADVTELYRLLKIAYDALLEVQDESHASNCTYRLGHGAQCTCYKQSVNAAIDELCKAIEGEEQTQGNTRA